jgi:TonB family protein
MVGGECRGTVMSLAPMFRPDYSEDLPSPNDSSTMDGKPQGPQLLTTAVAAESVSGHAVHGGEGNAADLVDPLATELVQVARMATGATGAAIAWVRGEEVLCAASTGADAPDPGERLDGRSGLVGVCLQTRELQQCNDTETDPRVDLDACRRLQIRSILVMPLTYRGELLGVSVLVSSRPNAFEPRDVSALLTLADRILENGKQVNDAVAMSSRNGPLPSQHRFSDETLNPRILEDEKQAKDADVTPSFKEGPPSSHDSSSDQPLTYPIVETEKEVKDGPATPWREEPVSSSSHVSLDETIVESLSPDHNDASQSVAKLPTAQASYRGHDVWTTVLFVCVVVEAALLGMLIGWEQAVARPRRNLHLAHAVSRTVSAPQTPPLASTQQPSSASSTNSSQIAGTESTSKPLMLRAARSPAPSPPNGLMIYQNGKVIFQKGASAPSPNATAAGSESSQLSHPNVSSTAVQTAANASVQPVPEGFATARLIHRVEPEYPSVAREQNIQGSVILDVQIGTDGTIQNITVRAGNPVLSQAAVAAVKQWKYHPYSVAGRFVQMQTRITINFLLTAN